LRIVNIETGLPTVDEARKKLLDELNMAKRQGVTAIKVIHGYGSSGTGGTLKIAIRKSLSLRRKEGKIRSFVGGEEWDIFEERTRTLLDDCPELSRDSDLNRHNSGITIVLL
jgi:hypothetical protein